MNKVFKIVSFFTVFLGLVAFFGFLCFPVKANEINESYDYNYNLEISNNSYYFSVSRNIDYNYVFQNFESFSFDIDILYNNINYNSCSITISQALGGIEITLIDLINNNRLLIFNYYDGGIAEYNNFDRFNLYNNTIYYIYLNPILNYFFNFENYILKGYYTFNQSIEGLEFENYNFNSPLTDFELIGTLVYLNEEGYYLFDSLSLNPTQDFFDLRMFNVNNQITSYEIYGQFTNDTDFLRYWYLDNQYIDTFLYEYLNNNGVFAFSYGGLDNNATFWDVINSYVNIPNTIIGGMLGFSIFNGTTLLIIFATITVIVLAIKIIKMVNWS